MKIIYHIVFFLFFFISCENISDRSHIEMNPNKYWLLIENNLEPSKHIPYGYTSGYINQKGDTMIPLDKYPRCFTDTFRYYALVIDVEKGLIGIDKNQNKLFNAVWTGEGTPVTENDGMILIKEKGKFGYANFRGEIVIEPNFDCAESFFNGKAKVSNDCIETSSELRRRKMSSSFFIDKKGTRIK